MRVQSKPSITSRSGWNAAAASCSGSNKPQYLFIHHSGDANDNLSKVFGNDEKGFMKRIQEIHMNSSWDDIGYNFAVGVKGLLMEGRDPSKQGGHTSGYNTKAIGVCVLGNYDIRKFTSAQEEALVDLLSWLCYKYDIDPSNIKGHRDVASKSCPGDDIYARMSHIRGKVIGRLNPTPE